MSQGRSGHRQIRQMNAAASAGVAAPVRPARPTDRAWAERLRALAGLGGHIVWVADVDGNFLDQVGLSAYSGLRSEAVLGWNWLQVIHPKERAIAAATWTRAVSERRPYEIVLRMLGADGDFRRFRVRATPILDAGGAVQEWVGVCADLTEPARRAESHEELLQQEREAREAAERDIARLNRLEVEREGILDMVAHELRNPLTSIKTVLQMTQRHLDRDEVMQQSQLESLGRSVQRMEALVKDLLSAAGGEARLLASERRDLRELCRHVAQDQRLATGRAITLAQPRRSVLADVDTNRMTQVLSNLISNAHKYSPDSTPIGVRLVVTGTYARISISDDGPGIPLEAQEHLFQRFYRVPGIEPIHTGDGGLGLGLAICRELIELHHGHIGVESLPGRGATFWVTVPIADPA